MNMVSEIDTSLWSVSIQGPDDIIACGSHLDAVKVANEFNRFWQGLKTLYPQKLHHPRMWAVPVEWPYTADSHAQSLKDGPGDDYAGMVRDALSASREPVEAEPVGWVHPDSLPLDKPAAAVWVTAEASHECPAPLYLAPPASEIEATPDITANLIEIANDEDLGPGTSEVREALSKAASAIEALRKRIAELEGSSNG